MPAQENKIHSFTCPVCGGAKDVHDGMPLELIGHPIDDLVRQRCPTIDIADLVCLACRSRLRAEFVEEALEEDRGALTVLEREVLSSLSEQELIARNVNAEFDKHLAIGDRVADRVAEFGGSWRFIILFGLVLAVWIAVNTVFLIRRPFDPFPFILLNLILSCIAALQAPFIMMSQNRQSAKDRLRAEHDYQVNLKAEIEIRNLTMKIDQLITRQWRRLLEIQRIQMEQMDDLIRKTGEKKPD